MKKNPISTLLEKAHPVARQKGEEVVKSLTSPLFEAVTGTFTSEAKQRELAASIMISTLGIYVWHLRDSNANTMYSINSVFAQNNGATYEMFVSIETQDFTTSTMSLHDFLCLYEPCGYLQAAGLDS